MSDKKTKKTKKTKTMTPEEEREWCLALEREIPGDTIENLLRRQQRMIEAGLAPPDEPGVNTEADLKGEKQNKIHEMTITGIFDTIAQGNTLLDKAQHALDDRLSDEAHTRSLMMVEPPAEAPDNLDTAVEEAATTLRQIRQDLFGIIIDLNQADPLPTTPELRLVGPSRPDEEAFISRLKSI